MGSTSRSQREKQGSSPCRSIALREVGNLEESHKLFEVGSIPTCAILIEVVSVDEVKVTLQRTLCQLDFYFGF